MNACYVIALIGTTIISWFIGKFIAWLILNKKK